MNRAARPARTATGRPLLALAGLVICWIGARVAVWQVPDPPVVIERMPTRLIELTSIPGLSAADRAVARIRFADAQRYRSVLARVMIAKATVEPRFGSATAFPIAINAARLSLASDQGPIGPIPASAKSSADFRSVQAVVALPPSNRVRQPPANRWSADLWLALRQRGGALLNGGIAVPVYGASQAGAVLRYRLVPASLHEPVVYGRVVQALERREGDVAVGLAARVAPGAPLIAHLEARVSRRGERVDLRPAAFLTIGWHDAPLAFGVRARGYGQAGYVGGPDATAFVDGNLIAEREMVRAGDIAVAAGAGLWGGAQRGAERLDVGPSASLRFPLGEGIGRLTLDYRLRLAGNAEPTAGAALTLSAGF